MTEENGITVSYTKNGLTLKHFISDDLLPTGIMRGEVKQQLIQAAKDLLSMQLSPNGQQMGPGGVFTVTEYPNIPHAARMMNQFRVEEGAEGTRKHFVFTGKVMCWCNCGTVTDWLDLYDSRGGTSDQVKEFFQEHQIAEEIGIRMEYVLGELAGYSINSDRFPTRLIHSCGWEKELLVQADGLLTNIVMEAQSNAHICGEVKQ